MAPLFDYKALNAAGKALKGTIDAESSKAARVKLKKQGVMVTQIVEKTTAAPGDGVQIPFLSGRVGVKDIAMTTRQLASLIRANIPLVEALTAITDQTENATLKITLTEVRQDVNEGLSLAKAMAKHPKVFDTIFINMVEAGESSGTLGLVLLKLADLKESQMRLQTKIISSMTYPALMMVVAGGIMVVIFAFVIPKLAKVFESMNKPMPMITKVILWISNALVDYWYVPLITMVFAIWIFRRYIKSKDGSYKWDVFKLKLPVIGSLVRMIAVTRFTSTLATLLGTGVPILNALNIAKNLVGSQPIAVAIANARENITEGQSIAEPLRRSGEFPPLVIHMIAIGEKTGELPDMLQNIATNYEEQVSTRIEGMTAMLEPLMIIFMGGMVGFIVMAVFVPLLDLSNIQTR